MSDPADMGRRLADLELQRLRLAVRRAGMNEEEMIVTSRANSASTLTANNAAELTRIMEAGRVIMSSIREQEARDARRANLTKAAERISDDVLARAHTPNQTPAEALAWAILEGRTEAIPALIDEAQAAFEAPMSADTPLKLLREIKVTIRGQRSMYDRIKKLLDALDGTTEVSDG